MRGATRLPRGVVAAIAALVLIGPTAGVASFAAVSVGATPSSAGHVLLVGTFHGVKGQYKSIQAAVSAAKPGDWVLVAPGDYHETQDLTSPPSDYAQGAFGSVLITTPDLHLRGMDRAKVIVDGTKPGSPACTSNPADQSYGNVVTSNAVGRNGITVFKASGVSVENLTVCNFLSGSQSSGYGVWWNGGDGTGKIGLTGYHGNYLSATSTFFNSESTAATYGIFASNAQGPSTLSQLYANNQNDSGLYVGGCKQLCGVTISNAWMEYNALGHSGTNSGGAIVITHSQFDHNQDGFDTNAHAPAAGSAAIGPTGTGMTLSGGRNDTVLHNTFANNGAWGAFFVPFPDANSPSLNQTCAGTGGHQYSGLGCVYDPQGDALLGNTFRHNGFFKNPTNSDFAELTLSNHVVNCFSKNVAPDGSYLPNLAKTEKSCTGKVVGGNAVAAQALYFQALCDTGLGTCPAGGHYPTHGAGKLHALPKLPSMLHPCKGVPAHSWCKAGKPI